MASELTWREAIERVLREAPDGKCYTGRDIAKAIIQQGLISTLELGAKPFLTAGNWLSNAIKNEGGSCPFQEVANGCYAWKGKAALASSMAEDEVLNGLITSFGMYWKRDSVEWTSTPKIWGTKRMSPDSWSIDFHRQFGIYLLYDAREVIYVGRSTDRPLGKRLKEHTTDRLSTRWDRFSWFGLCEISENGKLYGQPDSYRRSDIIPALEAILIEAVEPRQNRKRGDYLFEVEYVQDTRPGAPIPSEEERQGRQGYRDLPDNYDAEPLQ